MNLMTGPATASLERVSLVVASVAVNRLLPCSDAGR